MLSPSLYYFIYSVCVHVSACRGMWGHVGACRGMWGHADTGCLPVTPSPVFETGSLTGPNTHRLARLAGQPALGGFLPPLTQH